jgi:HD-like signal output (HDOD) protein
MMLILEKQLKTHISNGAIELPVLPAVGVQVLALTQDKDSDAYGLAGLIENDLSLTSYIMKVANSAAFSNYGKTQTLQQAIAKLGMKNIAQMVLTMTVGQSAFKSDSSTREITSYLWQHSLLCALWGREIARLCHLNSDVVFLNALLHQIGKPVVLHAINELLDDQELLAARDDLLQLIEKNQQTTGLKLARSWNLPESIITTISHIDEYDLANDMQLEVAAVNAARLLADIVLATGEPVRFLDAVADQAVLSKLNLYKYEIQLLDDKRDAVEQMMQALIV